MPSPPRSLRISASQFLSLFAVIGLLSFSTRAYAHAQPDKIQANQQQQPQVNIQQQQEPISDHADWATRHMAEEHHIANFDPGAFFSLHDYDTSGAWTPDEIRRTYGLDDESSRGVSAEKKEEVTRSVLSIFDTNGDGTVDLEEWVEGWRAGKRLVDFGLGPGHHGDDEYEYEIHHYEKFHDENTKEEDLTHPEDIAHFKKHDEEADAAERQEKEDRMSIVEQNIPAKFRVQT